MLTEIKHIIFDLDGTLIDSSKGVAEATNHALKKLGQKPRTIEEIVPFIGFPLEDMFASFCDAPINELKDAFQEKADGVIDASSRLMPGAADIVPALYNAGYILAVATTKYRVHTEGIIQKFGWNEYFSALASGDEVNKVKPEPDIVLLAIKKLRADKGTSVMVGDTVNDIYAARDAGIKVISVLSPFGNDDLAKHHPDLLLKDINELKMVFGL